MGDVPCSHPAPERVPPCRSSSLWPASKRFAWWLLKGLVKKLQTSSQALQHRWGNRRKLFAFLYVMLHISPADSFQFVEEIYTALQMVFFNRSSSHPKLKCLVLLREAASYQAAGGWLWVPARRRHAAGSCSSSAADQLPSSSASGSQGLISRNPPLKLVNNFHMYPCVCAGGAPQPAALVITLDYL